VTFDESSFPIANCLANYMSDEDPDDSDYASKSPTSQAVPSQVVPANVAMMFPSTLTNMMHTTQALSMKLG
jgi:hypothetical protein